MALQARPRVWEPSPTKSHQRNIRAGPSVYTANGSLMAQTHRFRRTLPIAQTISAAFFGGFGLWQRNQILAHTWLNSTARFHVWPWTYKFAVITNTPALLVGLLFSWPISNLAPASSEYAQAAPTLFIVPILWYWVGSRLDRPQSFANKTAVGSIRVWLSSLSSHFSACLGRRFQSEIRALCFTEWRSGGCPSSICCA